MTDSGASPKPLSARYVKQTTFGDPDGNCLEACFASLTGIPLQEIPHFLQDAWYFHYKRWFRERGWHIEYFDGKQHFPGLAIAGGPADRGLDHSCIYRDGKLEHDPHPSNSGLLSVDDYILVWPDLDTVAALQAQVAELTRERDELRDRKDGAYLERNRVVAALARVWPSGVARTAIEDWSEDWHGCVYIDSPGGQLSWHFHDSQAYLFDGLPPYVGAWDGHTTEEKYDRLAAASEQGETK